MFRDMRSLVDHTMFSDMRSLVDHTMFRDMRSLCWITVRISSSYLILLLTNINRMMFNVRRMLKK